MKHNEQPLADIGLGLGRQDSERQWQENTIEYNQRIKAINKGRKLISSVFSDWLCAMFRFQLRAVKTRHVQ